MTEPKELTLAELNALVAEKVMEWTAFRFYRDHYGEYVGRIDDWRPTTDWRDAGRVIDRMRELGWWLELEQTEEEEFTACYWKESRSPADTISRTHPLAITLAALAALTGERYSVKEE